MRNLVEYLIRILTPELPENEMEKKHKVFLLQILSYYSILSLLVVGIRLLYQGSITDSLILLGLFLLILINLVVFNPTRKYKVSSQVLVCLLGLVMVYTFYANASMPNAWPWLVFFPILSIILLDISRGLITALIAPVLLVPGMLLPEIFPRVNHEPLFLGTVFSGYFSLIAMIYFFYHTKKKETEVYQKKLEDSLKEAREKNEFISRLSHQLRTSLSNIMLVNDLVSSTKLTENQRDLFETLQASANNLAEAVSQMADVSVPGISQLKETNVPFSLKATLESILRVLKNSNKAETELLISETIPDQLIGDPIKLRQVFLNLLQGISQESDHINSKLSINIDMDRESREDLVLRARVIANRENDRFGGTVGSELSDYTFLKKLMGSYGRNLEVKTKGQITVFSFTCQYLKDYGKKSESGAEISTPAEKKMIRLQDARVLLVEDNLINQKIVLLSLRDMVKSIEVAGNGKEALDKFGTSQYDIILMDIQMPVMDGIIATKKIREIEASSNSHTPIIAITANALSGDRENCLAVGMNDYISKPFQVDILVQKMKVLLESQA